MSYTNAGFTGNDGTETRGWDPLEVQHFKDIENTLVADAIGSVKDTAGHKHASLYNPSKSLGVSVSSNMVLIEPGFDLYTSRLDVNGPSYLLGPVLFFKPYINTSTGNASASVDVSIYNAICWTPSTTTTGNLTITLTNPAEGQILPVSVRGTAAGNYLLIAGGLGLQQYAGLPHSMLLYYIDGAWSRMS